MAATFAWREDSGAASGTGGTTITTPTDVNWKNIGDSTTVYTAYPIVAGNNSFIKYQSGILSGTWNAISNGKWAHTATAFGAGLTLNGKVTSTYAAPVAAAMSSPTDMTTAIAIASGMTVNFVITGPGTASPAASVTGGGTVYTQFLTSQLVTTASAVAGDTATVTLTLQYDEN